jgi:2-oxoacid:acceptor oxidoreductase gamma subunit (pyruvate/2-ketoisovalerate family)
MLEIRFHGRGGQGAVIGSEVLAYAFFIENRYVQAFPVFGVERRGAPVTAFCRVDENPINRRNEIYEPDHVVVLDATLLESVGVTRGLKNGGTIIINTGHRTSHYAWLTDDGFRVFTVDATAIALENGLGSSSNPIVNTAILGAFSKATRLVRMDSVQEAIQSYAPVKKEENKRAARMAYEHLKGKSN